MGGAETLCIDEDAFDDDGCCGGGECGSGGGEWNVDSCGGGRVGAGGCSSGGSMAVNNG